MNTKISILLGAALSITGCASMQDANKAEMMDAKMEKMMAPHDGDLALPVDYQNWPVFIADIDKEKINQVRDIYINTQGVAVQKGDMFPDGTQFVMALYSAKQNSDGSAMKTADGKLAKGELSKVFIMEKGAGWSEQAPAGLANGDWVYAAYNADGSKAEADYNACRECHQPHSATDYVFHYDQYFGG